MQKVEVDLARTIVGLSYEASRKDTAKLRAALRKLGFSADGVLADPTALMELTAYCLKEGCGNVPAEP